MPVKSFCNLALNLTSNVIRYISVFVANERLNVSARFPGVAHSFVRSFVRDTIYTNKGIRTNLINGSPMEIIRHCFMTTALSFSSGASEIQLGSEREMSGRHGKARTNK